MPQRAWRKDCVWETVLSFHNVSPGDLVQVIRLLRQAPSSTKPSQKLHSHLSIQPFEMPSAHRTVDLGPRSQLCLECECSFQGLLVCAQHLPSLKPHPPDSVSFPMFVMRKKDACITLSLSKLPLSTSRVCLGLCQSLSLYCISLSSKNRSFNLGRTIN